MFAACASVVLVRLGPIQGRLHKSYGATPRAEDITTLQSSELARLPLAAHLRNHLLLGIRVLIGVLHLLIECSRELIPVLEDPDSLAIWLVVAETATVERAVGEDPLALLDLAL